MNTGIQDAHNLAWKIAGVLRGWASHSLLASYEFERRPVAEFNALRSATNANEMWDLLLRAATLVTNTGRHHEVCAALSEQIEYQRPHFDFSGQALGFRYGCDPVVADVVVYSPVVAPGARAPHFWLDSVHGRVSTLDLTATTFGLFTGCAAAAEWADAAGYVTLVLSVPLSHYAVAARDRTGDGPLSDPTGAMLAAYGIEGRTAVLVRPDGHICTVLPGNDTHRELMDAVTQFTTSGFGTKEVLRR
jgi:hypothetical protein